ncbi:MAG: hypothetical protein VYB54_07760 [Pseudomonadota bacterium]|nr:hypothetical protein [Pseudomonadota bacterium]
MIPGLTETRTGPLRPGAAVFGFLVMLLAGPALADYQIAGLRDANLGSWDGFGDLTAEIEHCVLADNPRENGNTAREYSVTARGSGPGGAFQLSAGPNRLTYELYYEDRSGRAADLEPNKATSERLRGIDKDNQFDKCLSTGQRAALLTIRIRQSELLQAGAGDYHGTLMLTISAP